MTAAVEDELAPLRASPEDTAAWVVAQLAGRYAYSREASPRGTWWLHAGRRWYVCDERMVLTAVRYELEHAHNQLRDDARIRPRALDRLVDPDWVASQVLVRVRRLLHVPREALS